jgi:hypothetical protein
MKVGKIRERGVDSAFSLVKASFEHPEEGFIVGEKITKALVPMVSAVLPPLTDVHYLFFEGYRSKNGMPGFAIFGRDPPIKRRYIVKLEYCSPDLADSTDIPDRVFTGRQPRPKNLVYRLEAPFHSPLCVPGTGDSKFVGLRQMLERMEAIRDSELGMGPEFYAQFEGSFNPSRTLPGSLVEELQKQDEFGDGRGRYVSVVDLLDESPKFQHGNVRNVSPEILMITDKHKLGAGIEPSLQILQEHPLYVCPDNIAAVYGKGVTQLYLAGKKLKNPA